MLSYYPSYRTFTWVLFRSALVGAGDVSHSEGEEAIAAALSSGDRNQVNRALIRRTDGREDGAVHVVAMVDNSPANADGALKHLGVLIGQLP